MTGRKNTELGLDEMLECFRCRLMILQPVGHRMDSRCPRCGFTMHRSSLDDELAADERMNANQDKMR